MVEFIDACVAPGNVALTVLVSLCLFYWLMVVLGALKPATFDVEFEAEEEPAEHDAEEQDGENDQDVKRKWAEIIPWLAEFLNVGRVPIMVLLTVWLTCSWLIAVLLHRFTGGWLVVFQILLLVPCLCIGAVLARYITMPLRVLRDKARRERREDRAETWREEEPDVG